jgi:hypothetical protein
VYRDRLVGMTRRELPGLVGHIYAEVKRLCLEIKSDEDPNDKKEYKQLCWKIVQELGRCVA